LYTNEQEKKHRPLVNCRLRDNPACNNSLRTQQDTTKTVALDEVTITATRSEKNLTALEEVYGNYR